MDITILKSLLSERGLTFQVLADKLGADRANLYNSLTKGNPTLQRLQAIAEVIGVPVWRLFVEEPKPEIYGSITYNGDLYNITTKEDLKALNDKVQSI